MSAFFGAPEWLALLPFLAFAAWQWRSLALAAPLRVLGLALLVVVLAEPRLPKAGRGLDLWVLVDRSASAADLIEPRRQEIETLLLRAKGTDDRLFFVDYADGAFVRSDSAGETFPGSPQRSRTGSAIHLALGRAAPDRSTRLLVLTDGFSTEPLTGVGERLVRQGVPLDVRLFQPDTDHDYRAESLRLPQRVQRAEPFLVELRVAGSPDGDVPFTIDRDGARVGEGTAAVRNGSAVVRFTDRIDRGGAFRYAATLRPARDVFPGNDRAEAWVEVLSGPRVLLVSSYADPPLAEALAAQGFEVETATDFSRLSVGRLSGARAVLLDNVPAYRLPADFLGALDAFVRLQGRGLLMAGGRFSFGAGGYFGSKIDSLLPVSMELRQEHRKLAVAMAIVMDRSGSMGITVGGVTKMDLANEGAARSIGLLGDNDAVSVIAVDSEAHEVVRLGTLGDQRAAVVDAVRRIQSGGGGIYVYTGLKAGWEQLKTAPQGQRHLILFADAADAEEPGDYQELLREMVAGGATVSVIGLGTETDVDAAFLKDVAARGKGRIFFNADPASLPALFAQETVAVARSAFLTDPVAVKPTPGWLEISARPIEGLSQVDAYNLSYLREDATAAALTEDEYKAPLVAFWQRGPGRAAAVSFPLGGEHSDRARSWPRYGDFVQTLTRWLMGEETPPGIGLRTRLEGTRLVVDLLFDQSWYEKLARSAPEAMLAEGASGDIRPLTWERLAPGHLETSAPLEAGRWYRGAVRVAGATLPFGPVEAPGGAEWSFDRGRLAELSAVSRASGGQERVDLSRVFSDAPSLAPKDLRSWALTAFLIVFLAEALRSRLGLPLARLVPARLRLPSNRGAPPVEPRLGVRKAARSSRELPSAARETVRAPAASMRREPSQPTPVPLEAKPVATQAAADRRRRFRRAKDRGL